MPAPEIDKLKSTLKYEASGPIPLLEEDLARIRGLDLVAEQWRGRGWLPWVTALVGVPITLFTAKHGFAPIFGVVTVVAVIVLAVVVSSKRKLDFENRRYEFAQGLIRLINWAPGAPARMGLVLSDIGNSTKVIGRNGDWTYYRDDWLYLEGQLADGVSLRYARTSYYDSYYFFSQTRSGNTIRTTTSTKKLWHFDDTVTLTFPPGQFPDPARLAASRDALGLPKVIEIKHFDSQAGSITLVVHGAFKWDAAPGAEVKGALDAIPFAGLLIATLYGVLGATPQVDLSRSGALPPPRAIIPKAPLTPKEYAIVSVAAVMGLVSAGFFLHANKRFDSSDNGDRYAASANRRLKEAMACQKTTPHIETCKPAWIAERRKELKMERDRADDAWDAAIISIVVGGVLAALSAGGLVTWRVLRKKRLIREAAEAEAAGAAWTGPEATPPPLAQPVQPANPWQQGAPPSGYGQPIAPPSSYGQPVQPPPSGYGQPVQPPPGTGQPPGGPPSGWRPPGT